MGTALLGMAMAVAALCATTVFGASLAHLVSSPALYGAPFQVYFASDAEPGAQSVVTGPLLDSLRRDHLITQVTLASEAQIEVNGSHVRTLAVTPVRGATLVSAVDGRQPGGDREIMLGAATMRATGARLGEVRPGDDHRSGGGTASGQIPRHRPCVAECRNRRAG